MLSIRKKKKKFRFRATKNFSARQFVTKISCRYVEERRYFDITGDCDLTLTDILFGVYNSARTRVARLQRRKENVADLSPAVKLLNFLSLDGRGMR
jgi:hypothetical protein